MTSEYCIRRSGLSITPTIDPANRQLPCGERQYAIYRRGLELHPETAATEAPAELLALLRKLNKSVTDASTDDPQIGIADFPVGHTVCFIASSQFKRDFIPIAKRGQYELRLGLGFGCQPTGIAESVAVRIAPALAAFMTDYHNTSPVAPIESPAEQGAREAGEQAAEKAKQQKASLDKAEKARKKRHTEAAIAVAEVVADTVKPTPAERRRGERLLAILTEHFGLSAK